MRVQAVSSGQSAGIITIGANMAFKPNYQQQRGDRARTKDQKKEQRLQRREEQSAARRKEAESELPPDGAPALPEPTEPGAD